MCGVALVCIGGVCHIVYVYVYACACIHPVSVCLRGAARGGIFSHHCQIRPPPPPRSYSDSTNDHISDN